MSKITQNYRTRDSENSELQEITNNFYEYSENSFYIWNYPGIFTLDSLFSRELNAPNSDIKLKVISKTFEEAERNIKNFIKSMKKYKEIKYITIKKIFPDNKSIYAYLKVENDNFKLVDITNGTIRKCITENSSTSLQFEKGNILITENGVKFKFDKIVYRDKNSEAWGYYFKENGELDTTYALIPNFDTFEYGEYYQDKTNY